MFRHRGKNRTFKHNLKLASLLSFVAGIVNVTGYFAVQKLTTNVTGHFAFFAEDIVKRNPTGAWAFLLYILSFCFGAFMSNILAEIVEKKNKGIISLLPVSFEVCILLTIVLLSPTAVVEHANLVACSLLFTIGLQNALVTRISNNVVRTTHLTGLFTDLGIELSQLLFYPKEEHQRKLRSSIRLRFAIIGFFFLGCVTGGWCYLHYQHRTLLLAVACLLAGLVYDKVKSSIIIYVRRHRSTNARSA